MHFRGLLFRSLFRVSPHSSCSLNWPGGSYVPDQCGLTYTNTLLLSESSLSLDRAFVCGESEVGAGKFPQISLILEWTFIPLELKEFHSRRSYINDSILGSIFFFLTGLHSPRDIVGVIPTCRILRIIPFVKWLSFIWHLVLPFHLYRKSTINIGIS